MSTDIDLAACPTYRHKSSKPSSQSRPQGLLSYWDGDEKALKSAGHMTI